VVGRWERRSGRPPRGNSLKEGEEGRGVLFVVSLKLLSERVSCGLRGLLGASGD
jgi:hypothetical protein